MKKILLLLVAAALFSSCMTTRTNVGTFKEDSKAAHADVYTYAKGKQFYLFWGLLPLGRTSVATPANQSCQVRTSYNFWDGLFSVITGGLFEMQTIRVKAIKNASTSALIFPESGNADPVSEAEAFSSQSVESENMELVIM